MSKLLRANFARIKKDKLFWLGIIFMIGLSAFVTLNTIYENDKYNLSTTIDNIFFGYSVFIGIVSSVFCSVFVGTEYSDGTIRNKIIVENNREAIYLSNLITNSISSIIMFLSYIIVCLAIGVPFIEFFQKEISIVIITLIGTVVMVIAFCSIFTLVSMLIQNKAVSAISCILGVFISLFISIMIVQTLSQSKMWGAYSYTNGDGELVQVDEQENPYYVTGYKRKIYEFFDKFLPTGQSLKYSSMQSEDFVEMSLYSLSTIVVTTAIGLFIFKKKDIK